MKNITIDQLGKEIQSIMDEYTEGATKVVEDTLPDVGKKAVKSIKQKIGSQNIERTGAYKKGWKYKTEKGRLFTTVTVYNKTRYQLTHLLENGHANRGGGKTDGIPHIKPVENEAVKNALNSIKRGLELL